MFSQRLFLIAFLFLVGALLEVGASFSFTDQANNLKTVAVLCFLLTVLCILEAVLQGDENE